MVLDLQRMNTMRPWRVAVAEYLRTEFADLVVGDLADASVA